MFDGRTVTERGRLESVNFTWNTARMIRPADGLPSRERIAPKSSSAVSQPISNSMEPSVAIVPQRT
jgi:hypothetical protein